MDDYLEFTAAPQYEDVELNDIFQSLNVSEDNSDDYEDYGDRWV